MALSRNLPGGTEEDREIISESVAHVPAESLTGPLPKTKQEVVSAST
jgi:hypothetical protein